MDLDMDCFFFLCNSTLPRRGHAHDTDRLSWLWVFDTWIPFLMVKPEPSALYLRFTKCRISLQFLMYVLLFGLYCVALSYSRLQICRQALYHWAIFLAPHSLLHAVCHLWKENLAYKHFLLEMSQKYIIAISILASQTFTFFPFSLLSFLSSLSLSLSISNSCSLPPFLLFYILHPSSNIEWGLLVKPSKASPCFTWKSTWTLGEGVILASSISHTMEIPSCEEERLLLCVEF